jgi:hypothetical protein
MTKAMKIATAALLGVAVLSTSAFADINKGKRIYMKKLKAPCGFNGAKFAMKHTQDEWENIKGAGKFRDEIVKICPNAAKVAKKLKDKYINDLYDFSYEYASDSGNVPSC